MSLALLLLFELPLEPEQVLLDLVQLLVLVIEVVEVSKVLVRQLNSLLDEAVLLVEVHVLVALLVRVLDVPYPDVVLAGRYRLLNFLLQLVCVPLLLDVEKPFLVSIHFRFWYVFNAFGACLCNLAFRTVRYLELILFSFFVYLVDVFIDEFIDQAHAVELLTIEF